MAVKPLERSVYSYRLGKIFVAVIANLAPKIFMQICTEECNDGLSLQIRVRTYGYIRTLKNVSTVGNAYIGVMHR